MPRGTPTTIISTRLPADYLAKLDAKVAERDQGKRSAFVHDLLVAYLDGHLVLSPTVGTREALKGPQSSAVSPRPFKPAPKPTAKH